MSSIGYYRYELSNVGNGVTKTVTLNIGGTPTYTKTITGKEFCTGSKLIKFLDKKGQYRFLPCNKFYQTLDNPTLIGKTNELITSILSDQTNSKSIGYRNDRVLSLVSCDLNETELTFTSDIYSSPRVYLYIGTGDDAKDWLQVTVLSSDNIVKRRKLNFGVINFSVQLPENFTIKMI